MRRKPYNYKFIRINWSVVFITILSLSTVALGIYSVVVSQVAKDQAEVIRGYGKVVNR